MVENNHTKKMYRDEEGAVITEPRNFLTNPPKKGRNGEGTQFGDSVPYMEDDYNRPRQLAKKEREFHQSKLQDKPFSQRAKGTATFNEV